MRPDGQEEVASTDLSSVAHTLGDRPAPGTLHAEPVVLRRAVEFIDANAHRPVSTGEIAAAARISGRSLQHGFRRHRDTTPLNYLRQVRMDRAHHDLHVADPARGETVAAIAARWGFRPRRPVRRRVPRPVRPLTLHDVAVLKTRRARQPRQASAKSRAGVSSPTPSTVARTRSAGPQVATQ